MALKFQGKVRWMLVMVMVGVGVGRVARAEWKKKVWGHIGIGVAMMKGLLRIFRTRL